MSAEEDDTNEPERAPPLDLKEANEQLLLATLRAHERADQAELSRLLVEQRAEQALRAAEQARLLAESRADRATQARTLAQREADRIEAALLRAERNAKELAERERDLHATGQMREELIGIVGHDMRNPLTSITLAAALLARDHTLTVGVVNLVQRIVRSATRMKRMITILTEFTRSRLGGGLPIDPGPTDLRDVCRLVVEELETLAAGPIVCEFEGDLRGIWDGDQLITALSNIVGNAIDYATPGTTIQLRAWADKAWARIEVTNHGEPIAPEVLPFLFDAFRRGRPLEKTKAGNLGLGLYIAHQIFFSHGGSLVAWSSGGFTTFAMRLLRSSSPDVLRANDEQRQIGPS